MRDSDSCGDLNCWPACNGVIRALSYPSSDRLAVPRRKCWCTSVCTRARPPSSSQKRYCTFVSSIGTLSFPETCAPVLSHGSAHRRGLSRKYDFRKTPFHTWLKCRTNELSDLHYQRKIVPIVRNRKNKSIWPRNVVRSRRCAFPRIDREDFASVQGVWECFSRAEERILSLKRKFVTLDHNLVKIMDRPNVRYN